MIAINELLTLINEERRKAGVAALAYRPELTNASNIRARESFQHWSHDRPDGKQYYTVDDRIYGENLAKKYNTAKDIVTAWMNSESHRRNLLAPDFKGACIGQYEHDNKLWVSLEFTRT